MTSTLEAKALQVGRYSSVSTRQRILLFGLFVLLVAIGTVVLIVPQLGGVDAQAQLVTSIQRARVEGNTFFPTPPRDDAALRLNAYLEASDVPVSGLSTNGLITVVSRNHDAQAALTSVRLSVSEIETIIASGENLIPDDQDRIVVIASVPAAVVDPSRGFILLRLLAVILGSLLAVIMLTTALRRRS